MSLKVESLIPAVPVQAANDETSDAENSKPSLSTTDISNFQSRRKYALVQRLTTGDYWSSISSVYPSLSLEGKDLKSIETGYAELVSIFPAPPIAPSVDGLPKLGDYVKKRPPVHSATQEPRRLSSGKFLDYGPYASFAPTFDQDGVEVGQPTLSEVVWYRQLDRRRRERANAHRNHYHNTVVEESDEVMEVDRPASSKANNTNLDSSLEGLLSPDEVASVKQALGSLELENAVDELLTRNALALARLERLQTERLLSPGGGSKSVEVGSEEWDTGTLRCCYM